MTTLREGLERAIALLEDSPWNEHHCQCPVGFRGVPDGPVGCDECICFDEIAPLRQLLADHDETA